MTSRNAGALHNVLSEMSPETQGASRGPDKKRQKNDEKSAKDQRKKPSRFVIGTASYGLLWPADGWSA
jgi:hypothetical protein